MFLSFFNRERFPLFVSRRYCVPTRTFLRPFEGQKRPEAIFKRSKMVRNVGRLGSVKGQGGWTVPIVQDKRSETFAKSRSRFKIERNTVKKIKPLNAGYS